MALSVLRRRVVAILAACLSVPAAAAPAPLVFIAPLNHAMPLARYENGLLQEGILKDIGEEIGRKLARPVRFLAVPGKRVADVLTRGEADAVCYVLPYWIDGDFHWTRPFIPNSAVIAARQDAPVVGRIADLADIRVGSVLGYRHPALEAVLGERFQRDIAPDMERNLRKLAAGRLRYAITEDIVLSWHLKSNPSAPLRKDLVFETFEARCALSRQGAVTLAEFEHAVDAILRDGTLTRVLQRYR